MVTNQEEDLRERLPFILLNGQSGGRFTSPSTQSHCCSRRHFSVLSEASAPRGRALAAFRAGERLRAPSLSFFFCPVKSHDLGFRGILEWSWLPHPSLRADLGARRCAVSLKQPFPHDLPREYLAFSPPCPLPDFARLNCVEVFTEITALPLDLGITTPFREFFKPQDTRLADEAQGPFSDHAFLQFSRSS